MASPPQYSRHFAAHTAYAAGILPYTLVNGKVYFLLGKDIRDGAWSDFGGKSEPDDVHVVDTACREFFEETCGILIDPKALRLRMSALTPFSQ